MGGTLVPRAEKVPGDSNLFNRVRRLFIDAHDSFFSKAFALFWTRRKAMDRNPDGSFTDGSFFMIVKEARAQWNEKHKLSIT
jgi:hypothetical protein